MKIAVVGGGTAGWMTAVHISHHFPSCELHHIYDSRLPPIGVGEGTLPSFPRWLHEVSQRTFVELQPLCHITPKKGVRFENWGRSRSQFNHHFGGDSIAYHISAAHLCTVLAEHSRAIQTDQHVMDVQSNGREVVILLADGRRLTVDFAFDARGFPQFHDDEHVLLTEIPTNAALLRRGPVAAFQGATRAVARPHGWIFVIPLAIHTAYGYIYNHTISGKEAVKRDFDAFFQIERVTPFDNERSLHFPNFRQRAFFDGAHFKIGNAASFLEPLEATAIGVIIQQLQAATYWLRDELVGIKGEEKWQPAIIQKFNEDLAHSIQAIALFVSWHYAQGSRFDTPFWHFALQNFAQHLARRQDQPAGLAFKQMLAAGESFSDNDDRQRIRKDFGGFDAFSFAQVGHGIGYYPPSEEWRLRPETKDNVMPEQTVDRFKNARRQLERMLLDGNVSLAEWGQRLTADYRQLLFYLQLCALIKTGPANPITPGYLVSVAQQAADEGHLPLATPFELRQLLRVVETRLYEAGAWATAHPLWWHPLPPPSAAETMWTHLHQNEWIDLPSLERVTAVFARPPASPLWLSLPTLLTHDLTRQLHRELETAYQRGELLLERGGVGADDHHAHQRTDRVMYVTGQEPSLLKAAPTFAALAQWCLVHLGDFLRKALPIRELFAPQRAMLSRYPAPSTGFAPHMDNPGGAQENGRTLTCVMYLNAPETECHGGEIALWAAGTETTLPPAAVLPPASGAAVLFDSRAIAHQVRPLADGPARWALSLWFNDIPQQPTPLWPKPELTLTDILLPLTEPPLPPGVVLFHELNDDHPSGEIVLRRVRPTGQRVGIVCTVYGGGQRLDAWCAHHFSLGVDHIVLIFSHLEEASETADAARLQAIYPTDRLTIWSNTQIASTRWPALPDQEQLAVWRQAARSGVSSQAVAARQTLNASVALQAAKTDELGGSPLTWLIHLDVDEWFFLEGAGRGGATLAKHFSAATQAGFQRLRYVNHELLLPPTSTPLFKVNSRLAAARLGSAGWSELVAYLQMAPSDQRPYFNGYVNGKSAVSVSAGVAAAGVHSWAVENPTPDKHRFLAGPSILHYRWPSPEDFQKKYLHMAISPTAEEQPLFDPSPAERAALLLIHELREAGADDETVADGLHDLYEKMTTFSATDVELLREAGLLLSPNLEYLA